MVTQVIVICWHLHKNNITLWLNCSLLEINNSTGKSSSGHSTFHIMSLTTEKWANIQETDIKKDWQE